ncbi:MAG: ABC transporter substrate-binding protein [Candidatus Aquicultor sp.]
MRKIIAGLLILALSLLAIGCSTTKTATSTSEADKTATEKATSMPTTIRVGTLPTEDTLAIHVADQKGIFKNRGLDVKVTVFKSAQERDAALQAGQIDGFMGDIVAVAALHQSGTPVSIVSILLGATPDQGRFGIVAPPKSTIATAAQLKGVPIATSSNTITEYVIDSLLKENGFKDPDIKKVEIKALPVRMETVMSGKVQAAALPDPLLALAVKQGAHLIVDDTKGANLSQTVLVFRKDFLGKDENKTAIKSLLEGINDGVTLINKNPDTYRKLLVEKAKLPKPIEDSYKINTYPEVQLPTKDEVGQVLDWMVKKNIVKPGLTYKDLVNQEVQPS